MAVVHNSGPFEMWGAGDTAYTFSATGANSADHVAGGLMLLSFAEFCTPARAVSTPVVSTSDPAAVWTSLGSIGFANATSRGQLRYWARFALSGTRSLEPTTTITTAAYPAGTLARAVGQQLSFGAQVWPVAPRLTETTPTGSGNDWDHQDAAYTATRTDQVIWLHWVGYPDSTATVGVTADHGWTDDGGMSAIVAGTNMRQEVPPGSVTMPVVRRTSSDPSNQTHGLALTLTLATVPPGRRWAVGRIASGPAGSW